MKMAKKDVDVIDDPDMFLDEVDASFDLEAPEMMDLDSATDSGSANASESMTEGEVAEARAAISASKDSADQLINASRELETLVFGVIQDEGNSLAGTEVDIADAKDHLNSHSLKRAKKSVKKAEKSLVTLEEDVLHLRRNIAMVHRLLTQRKINEGEVETILLRLRSATGAAEMGDVNVAANEVEHLVDDLIGGNTSTLNPFLFRHFWLGLDTRWPAGGDEGILIVRIINDGPVAMPNMRLAPPVPEGWTCVPTSVDLPIIAPGGNLPLRFEVKANRRYGADEVPLSRKLAISTAYEMRTGEITATIRAQNRSMEPLQDIVLSPWIPPGFTTAKIPFINRLAPDEVAVIRMPLRIKVGSGVKA